MSKKFFPTFESAANDFAAAKLQLGEFGIIRANGNRYNVVPVKDTTQLVVGDSVFTRAGSNYGIYNIIAIDGRWYYVGNGDKRKGRVIHAQIFGKVVP